MEIRVIGENSTLPEREVLFFIIEIQGFLHQNVNVTCIWPALP
jgi:hypothetical protein